MAWNQIPPLGATYIIGADTARYAYTDLILKYLNLVFDRKTASRYTKFQQFSI